MHSYSFKGQLLCSEGMTHTHTHKRICWWLLLAYDPDEGNENTKDLAYLRSNNWLSHTSGILMIRRGTEAVSTMEMQNTETSDLLKTAVLIWTLPHLPCDLSLKTVSYLPLADFFMQCFFGGVVCLFFCIWRFLHTTVRWHFVRKKIKRKISYKLTVPLFFDIKLYEDIGVRKCV